MEIVNGNIVKLKYVLSDIYINPVYYSFQFKYLMGFLLFVGKY